MYINLLYLPLFSLAYLFFLFLSTYLLVLFSLLYSQLAPCFSFVFQFVLQIVSFVLVEIIFGFLCLLGQSFVLYFCWTVFILLMGVYVYIQSHFLFLLLL